MSDDSGWPRKSANPLQRPDEPNPPAPRTVSSRSATSTSSTDGTGLIIN